MYGWVIGKNVNLKNRKGWKLQRREEYSFSYNLLNKFPDDIVDSCNVERDCFLDGYVLNKTELMEMVEAKSWKSAFEKICKSDVFLQPMRGAFCGFIYTHETGDFLVYSDHMGTRAVYYYCIGDKIIIASNVAVLAETLKENELDYHFDENAAKYMLTYGYMLDDTTFIHEVKRVLPGQYVRLNRGVQKTVYYRMTNEKKRQMTESEAIEKIDTAFRRAIGREFEKDREYGYRHLVDLSGGLDSRMVCWVAHEMGYTDQLNFTYCRNRYLDQSISEKIAETLKHEYVFKSLDDAKWMYDIDEMIEKNNGAALYHGMTGGNRFLSILDKNKFGIEHTGMVGDVIPSSFYKEESIAYGKPEFGRHQYSEKLRYDFDERILYNFPNQEIFALYTRGLLGAASSYMIRQSYFETSSPFLDVDFVDVCLSLPFSYRKSHSIYLEWINSKYPEAAEFGWEKWGGVKPKKSHIKYRKVVTTFRLIDIYGRRLLKMPEKNYMNPLDYWFEQDAKIQEFYDSYYEENIDRTQMTDGLRQDLKKLYQKGNIYEKGMVLTILGAVKRYF